MIEMIRRHSVLAFSLLCLAGCAQLATRPDAAPANAKTSADGLSPENRVAFFVNHARNGECDEVAKGLDSGIPVNQRDTLDQTALIAAVSHNSLECVHLLLTHGADANVADNAGWTPLIFATYFGGNEALLGELLAHGAEINARNDRGLTALYLASASGHAEQVKFLLDRGADRSIATQSGYTPLRVAQLKGFTKVSMLLDPTTAAQEASAGSAPPVH